MLDNSSEILLTGAGSSGDSVFSGFGSDLNTPVGSEIDDSTETTQSDEEGDDFIAELTRQMAENMLQEDEDDDDDENSMTSESFDLSVEQSNSTPKYCHGQGLVSTTNSQTPTSVLPNPSTQIYPNHSPAKHEYRQLQKRESGHGSRRAGFLTAFQAGPGMRVVFLGGVGSRKSGSSGTGVFFPQLHATNSTAAAAVTDHRFRKRTGCSTVLVPERVLQTLQHHFEKRAAQVHSNGALHTPQNQRLQSDETPPTIVNNQELQLPQEWTY